MAVAYNTYAREQLKLGFKVLSQSSVYRSIKGQFRTRRRIPFKDTQCTDCVNNSLLVDALIVSKVKGIKRRITENILNSLCPIDTNINNKESQNGACRKLEWQQDRETISELYISPLQKLWWNYEITRINNKTKSRFRLELSCDLAPVEKLKYGGD